jgi:hypothetical protein
MYIFVARFLWGGAVNAEVGNAYGLTIDLIVCQEEKYILFDLRSS